MSNETMTGWERQQQRAHEFVARLERLDAGGLARLKRNAGRSLAEAHDVHRVFFQVLPYDVHERRQEDYFLIATLFPLVKQHSAQAGGLGASLRRVRQVRTRANNGRVNSLDRRFQSLLDSDREQLPFRLRQAIRLIAVDRDRIAVNWEKLLLDVLAWEHPAHHVQLRWAREYFVGSSTLSTDTESNEAETQGDQS